MKQHRVAEESSVHFREAGVYLWLAAAVAFLVAAPAALAYPAAGVDAFDSMAIIKVSSQRFGIPETDVVLVGPTQIVRGDPYDPGDGLTQIDTRIEQMVLSGSTPLGGVLIRLIPPAPGQIKRKQPGADFPADSWFKLRVEVQIRTPTQTVRLFSDPATPILLMAVINAIPPFGAQYMPDGTFVGVDLLDESGQVAGVISHVGHFVGQHPTFSVAPGGPSSLNPADLFGRPTAAKIRAAGLGLVSGDDLDALSYGFDTLFPPLMDVRLSVDPASRGRLGSAVRREADKSPKEPNGDEFRVTPFAQSGGGSNVQMLDDTGDTAPPFPLQIADDVDALTQEPPEFVDGNGDGIPEKPVYFSLAKGSPSLATLGVSPSDVLVTMGGTPPTVFIPHANLALTEQDDIDAMCLSASSKSILFSLAPGSPSLGTAFTAADTFLVALPPATELKRWFSAANLGLDPTDNLNALKCHGGEIDEFPQSQLALTMINGQSTLAITATCQSGWAVGTIDGATGAGQNRGVPLYLSSLNCQGTSSAGPVNIRLRSTSEFPNKFSFGQIFDATDDGRLGIMPWSRGEATANVDLYLNLSIGDTQNLHNADAIRISGKITRKPPLAGEKFVRVLSSAPQGIVVEKNSPQVAQAGPIPLFLEGGVATSFSIVDVTYMPDARPKPAFTAAGFRDAAAFGAPASAGGLASLFGTFDTALQLASAIPLPRSLGGAVQVRFRVPAQSVSRLSALSSGGKDQAVTVDLPAPLLFVSDKQINLQIPWEVGSSAATATAIVSVNGVDSDAIEVPLAPVSPGIFTFDFGPGHAVAINPDGTVAHAANSIPGVASQPAVIGQAIIILCSGLGVTTPPGITGANSYDAEGNFVRRDAATTRVLIGGVEAQVVFAGLSPEFVGVDQINAVVPAGVTPGDAVSLVIEVNGQRSRDDVTMAVAAAP